MERKSNGKKSLDNEVLKGKEENVVNSEKETTKVNEKLDETLEETSTTNESEKEFNVKALHYYEIYTIRNTILRVIDNANNRTKMVMYDILDKCEEYIERMRKMNTYPANWDRYKSAVNNVISKYCETMDGKPIYYTMNGEPTDNFETGSPRLIAKYLTSKTVMDETNAIIEKEHDELKVKFKDVYEARVEINNKLTEFINEEVGDEIQFNKIHINSLPELNYEGSAKDLRVLMKSILITE